MNPPTQRPAYSRPSRLIAVWQATPTDFPKWRAIGVNCLVCIPQGQDPAAWIAAAQAQGLYYVRQLLPTDTQATAAADPWLIGFLHNGEIGVDGTTPAQVAAEYAKTPGWSIPWVTNIAGGNLLGFSKPPLNAGDWMPSTDIPFTSVYPAAGWGIGIECATNGNVTVAAPAEASDVLAQWKPGAQQFVCLEICKQGLSWLPNGGRDPTPTEVWAEVGPLIPRTNVNVCWFTISLNPWAWDNTSPAQKETMRAVNGILSK